MGAGVNTKIGWQSALEDKERIKEVLDGTNMLFIAAGMGGRTSAGAAPIIGEIAKNLKILTVAVVTKLFAFEGNERMCVVEKGIKNLEYIVGSLIVIPNEILLNSLEEKITLLEAFKNANNVLFSAVHGIAQLIIKLGLINIDFADVRTIMFKKGAAIIGSGISKGEFRAQMVVGAAMSSTLLDNINLFDPQVVLVNILVGIEIEIVEFKKIGSIIKEFTSKDAIVMLGTVIDPEMNNYLSITLVVTGLKKKININLTNFMIMIMKKNNIYK